MERILMTKPLAAFYSSQINKKKEKHHQYESDPDEPLEIQKRLRLLSPGRLSFRLLLVALHGKKGGPGK